MSKTVVGDEKAKLIPSGKTEKGPAWGKRHMVLFFTFLGMFLSKAMRFNLSMAVVAMVNNTQLPESTNINYSLTDTCPETTAAIGSTYHEEGEFNWDATTLGLVLSSYTYGYFLTQVLGGQLAQQFGGRLVLAMGVGITALLTLLTPVLARLHVVLLIATRFLEGTASGVVFSASSVLLCKWAPRAERSRFGAIALAGYSLGAAFAVTVTGLLSGTNFAGGWPSSFYVFGLLSFLWVLAFMVLMVENPEQDKNISIGELHYILQTTGSTEKTVKTPWRSVLTCLPVWAMVIGHSSQNWAYYALLETFPTYLKQVLKIQVSENGLLTALPYLGMTGVEIFGSFLADFLLAKKVFSILNIRRLSSAIACFPACILMLGEGFVGCNKVAAVVLVSLAIGIMGLASSGFMIAHYDIAPRQAGTIGGLSNMIATVPVLLGPSIVMAITDNQPKFTRWRWVFILSSAIYALGGAFYVIFASAEEQPWAKSDQADSEQNSEQSEKANSEHNSKLSEKANSEHNSKLSEKANIQQNSK